MLEAALPWSPSRRSIGTIVAANAATVGALYVMQALGPAWKVEFGDSAAVRLLPGLSLAGYALGVAASAFLSSDLGSPKGLSRHGLMLMASLVLAACAVSPLMAAAACFLVGLGCSMTQRLLTIGGESATHSERASAIGWIVAGGLTGLVLTRACVPVLATSVGHRAILVVYAILVGLASAASTRQHGIRRHDGPATALPSALALWRSHPALRHAAVQQACVFAVYNFAWAQYPSMMRAHGLSSAMPILAVASLGAVSAVVAGRLCRRREPADVAGLGFAALGIAAALVWLGSGAALPISLGVDAVGVATAAMVLVDCGTQLALVANQARAQGVAPTQAARGRVAATVTTAGFIGGAFGAFLGNW